MGWTSKQQQHFRLISATAFACIYGSLCYYSIILLREKWVGNVLSEDEPGYRNLIFFVSCHVIW